jgi:hypothetical protein
MEREVSAELRQSTNASTGDVYNNSKRAYLAGATREET